MDVSSKASVKKWEQVKVLVIPSWSYIFLDTRENWISDELIANLTKVLKTNYEIENNKDTESLF